MIAEDLKNLLITRILNAPPLLIFKMWTEREHLIHWCAPNGFTIPFCEGDARPGGMWRSCLRSPEGVDHWVQGVYREIIEPERLVFTHAWEDDEGNPKHETLVTITFEPFERKTKMIFQQSDFESTESRDGHKGGWEEAFDKLSEYLKRF